jgi:hypothetical protein
MEFTVKYDKHSLGAAAKTLFFHRWYPLFPGFAVSLVIAALSAGAISFVLSGFVLTTAIFILLGISSAITSLGAFALHRHTMLRLSGEVARIELAEDFVRVDSVLGKAELPWSSITEIEKDVWNVLLFVSRGTAIVIPTASIPHDAQELIERKRGRVGIV